MKINKYKGVRDFYPEDMLIQNHIYDVWRNSAKNFGFSEIDTPIIEPIELFTAKSGEEIRSQLYNFVDKGEREITLRPETTPSVARLVVQKQKELKKPMKWFSVSQCFRYEQPQAGRLRNFVQFNADTLGIETSLADAENIALSASILNGFGLNEKDFFIRLSHRKLINSVFEHLKIKKAQEVFRLIDKKNKISDKDFNNGLKELGLNDSQIEGIEELFGIDTIDKLENSELEYDTVAFTNLKEIADYLCSFGFEDYIMIDLSVVRGFDYYTGVVFELFDRQGKFRALAGGGRYDDLVGIFDGDRCPGIGFGMGDVVLGLFLEEKKLLEHVNESVDYFIGTLGNVSNVAVKLATKLRKEGSSVNIEIGNRNVKKQMNYANSIGAKKVIIIGSNEIESGVVKVKEMKTGTETDMKL
jgi:histidyl-tRNA synthetase